METFFSIYFFLNAEELIILFKFLLYFLGRFSLSPPLFLTSFFSLSWNIVQIYMVGLLGSQLTCLFLRNVEQNFFKRYVSIRRSQVLKWTSVRHMRIANLDSIQTTSLCIHSLTHGCRALHKQFYLNCYLFFYLFILAHFLDIYICMQIHICILIASTYLFAHVFLFLPSFMFSCYLYFQ